MRRSYSKLVTVAANTNEQKFTLTTEDDYRERRVSRVFVGYSGSAALVSVYVAGQLYATVDYLTASDQNLEGWKVELTAPPTQQIVVSVQDVTGTGASNVPITVFYDVSGTP